MGEVFSENVDERPLRSTGKSTIRIQSLARIQFIKKTEHFHLDVLLWPTKNIKYISKVTLKFESWP